MFLLSCSWQAAARGQSVLSCARILYFIRCCNGCLEFPRKKHRWVEYFRAYTSTFPGWRQTSFRRGAFYVLHVKSPCGEIFSLVTMRLKKLLLLMLQPLHATFFSSTHYHSEKKRHKQTKLGVDSNDTVISLREPRLAVSICATEVGWVSNICPQPQKIGTS